MPEDAWDWDPLQGPVLRDPIAAFDALRERCGLARSENLGWSVLRRRDALTVLGDWETFSSRASSHLAVPNGMDPPEHTRYRAIVDRCFSPALVTAFEPAVRGIAAELVTAAAARGDGFEVMKAIAEPYAARAQCAYLGWPADMATALQDWAADSARATRARDRVVLDRVAARFERIIVEQLDRQRVASPDGPVTLTARLLQERMDDAPLPDATLVSMLRNWTAGELGTIAAAVGIVVEHLARDQELQAEVRASPHLRQAAMDEMLRLEAPLIANRRRTTRPVMLQGRAIPADEPVTILWPAVQRDPDAAADVATYHLDRDPRDNLLYGRGPHACPGEGLARLELGVILEELFRVLPGFVTAPGHAPVRAAYPAAGFTDVRIVPSDHDAGPG